ncbi:MAG: LysE family translocator [Gammaproteobacteria bacterium]|nr:LysE family translocator [Gammaproteobacteria bacterium]
MNELQTFLALAAAHLIAVSSPGPDFAIILRQSIRNGFIKTLPVAIGIGSGILVHVLYSVMGLGIIIATNTIVFNSFKICGVAYLLYVAFMIWKSNSSLDAVTAEPTTAKPLKGPATFWQLYQLGFLTNALNVKATIFFLSVYVLIAGDSPLILQIAYGIYMAVATMIFFTGMAALLGGKMREFLGRHLMAIEKSSAVALAILALMILFYNPPQFS